LGVTASGFFISQATRAAAMFNDSDDREELLHKSCGRIQEEEFCRILNLRKNLQFSDVLIKHINQYQSLGWHLAAVNAENRVHQILDFKEPQKAWSEKLIELSLGGVEIKLGVRIGSSSGLLVVEVPKQERVFPFRRGDWSSSCVAETGAQLEQHYYELPAGWQLPSSFFLKPFEVKVFGEGELVLAPPSLEPRTQDNWHWLTPPWDQAPSQPPPLLRKIIEYTAPAPDSWLPAPVIPSWEEIYPAVASHPDILQAMMVPAPSQKSYYQRLLRAASAAGLDEPQLLLGLLWHAPLGDARERPRGWKYLQKLLNQGESGGNLHDEGPQEEETRQSSVTGLQIQAVPEVPGSSADSQGGQPVPRDYFSRTSAGQVASPDWPDHERPTNCQKASVPHPGNGNFEAGWQELFRASQENLLVERRRYEAMIYELGKLEVWQEIGKQERRENKNLNLKLETHLAREVDYLRHLVKKNS
jgi:hypothetical protein